MHAIVRATSCVLTGVTWRPSAKGALPLPPGCGAESWWWWWWWYVVFVTTAALVVAVAAVVARNAVCFFAQARMPEPERKLSSPGSSQRQRLRDFCRADRISSRGLEPCRSKFKSIASCMSCRIGKIIRWRCHARPGLALCFRLSG